MDRRRGKVFYLLSCFFILSLVVETVFLGCAAPEPKPTEEESTDKETEEKPHPKPEIESIRIAGGKESVRTGEELAVVVEGDYYDTVTYRFDREAGFQDSETHVYNTFGVKTIEIKAQNKDNETVRRVSIPVIGKAEVRVDKQELQHSKNPEKGIVTARITGNGDYDTVVVFYNDKEVFRSPQKERYEVNIPFVGERSFRPHLYHKEHMVAECNEVTITGLNTPPKLVGEFSKLIVGKTGEPVTFTLADDVQDENEDTLLFEMKHAPETSSLDPHTGEFTWVPEKSGYFLIEFYVYDYPYKEGDLWLQRMLTIK